MHDSPFSPLEMLQWMALGDPNVPMVSSTPTEAENTEEMPEQSSTALVLNLAPSPFSFLLLPTPTPPLFALDGRTSSLDLLLGLVLSSTERRSRPELSDSALLGMLDEGHERGGESDRRPLSRLRLLPLEIIGHARAVARR